MTFDANTGLARSFVDEWARAGVTDACVAPGSRSTPLALALAGDERIRVHVQLDERSASFFALGLAKATGRPAVVLCTSGTAAAEFHAAVLEAHHARVPLIVCTADRPFELRDTGAGQTIDQVGLYGGAVRWAVDVAAPGAGDDPTVARSWRATAARAVATALGRPAGPVHLNLAFREPLVPTGDAPLVVDGRAGSEPWVRAVTGPVAPSDRVIAEVASRARGARRGLVVAGWGAGVRAETVERLAARLGWPVLADPIANARAGAHTISTYEPLARAGFLETVGRPDLVLRFGAALTSKVLTGWLDPSVPQVVVDPDGAWLDPHRATHEVMVADPERFAVALARACESVAARAWLDAWCDADAVARAAVDDLLDSWEEPFEGRVARDVLDALPDGGNLVVASSMPVRDVEAFARPRAGVRVLANRGVNGIDGFVSTALGVAAARSGPTVALTGDLGFLHDTNGLLGVADRGLDATIVVVDNGGGGIFSFLPQADHGAHFEELFATAQPVDLDALAAVHRVPATHVDKASELAPALRASLDAGGVRLLIVTTDRTDNVARHRAVWDAVAHALRA
ncbi:MAG TPA: 2-succinyl-5-enolpyruvyl-6-hydroxy-3-cyclohexene-1-carboxylic-acid synthase [Acidimicrobiia bacterium]|jgi:2-succinyl-5-enolpyruvyl-6-hydroxy-3-cyclohexene-1-carboxylate synthase